ncbi:hypothetical protein ACROYT_G001120 [Oculina patagonica]
MINKEEIIEAIGISLVVATFLLNTDRALKAIELCKESMALLNNKALSRKQQFGKQICGRIYRTMFDAYCRIHDNSNAITYGRKLLVIYSQCGETFQEGWLSIQLATIYQSQHRFVEAKELYERAVTIMKGIGNKNREEIAYANLGTVFQYLGDYDKAKECLEKALAINMEIGNRAGEAVCYENLGTVFQYLGDYVKAKEYLEKGLAINMEIANRGGEATCYGNLGTVFQSLGDYVKAKEYHEKALVINTEIGDRVVEAAGYGHLGNVFRSLGDYDKAKEYLEKALAISMEIGYREGEAACYGNLGEVFRTLRNYVKAIEYHEKALAIIREIGDRAGEATCYGNLGTVFKSLGDYVRTKEYLEKALAINMEIGDRTGEAIRYGSLGTVFNSLGDYDKAKEYLEKALAINMEIGDRKVEATWYENLGNVFRSLGDYDKAKEYLKKALAIIREIGDRAGEATCYGNLGTVFKSLGDYVRAKEYLEKTLAITIEIGDRAGEATCYGNLGNVFNFLGDYDKAKEYIEKALAISIEIGQREGKAACYGNLGEVFRSLGNYVKALEYLEKALAISMEIGHREGEATCYGNLGTMFQSLGEYVKAEEYLKKALVITAEIGDRAKEAAYCGNLGDVYLALRQYRKSNNYFEKALAMAMEIFDRPREAESYSKLGAMFQFLGDNVKAKEYYEKAIAIRIEIGDRKGEAENYQRLGIVFLLLGECNMAKEYFEKALSISKVIRHGETEFNCYCYLTLLKVSQDKFHEAFSYLFQGIEICENLRAFNADNDQIKISFADMHVFPYQVLSELFCVSGDANGALYVAELGRARALTDLMATQYSAETHISANPQSWIGIENIMTKENNCSCLYISYHDQTVFLWILKTNGVISFRTITVDKNTLHKRLAQPAENLDEFFAFMAKSFRSFGILSEEVCEDRSLSDIEPDESDSSQEERLAAFRHAKGGEDPELSLTLFHEMLILPVVDLLREEPEIIVVPDRNLYRVPFAALLDKSGKYLSETFRIRIIPSLATLELIQNSPADYHSQTGALIVGDPDVGDVIYNGRLKKNFVPLPGARKEAEMIGRMLDVQPLLGEHATKQAVLQRIDSVSLIHFAAHGNAERGEIALAPPSPAPGIPQEDDYLLKMSDISQVQLRAKLVVLSCCHSGRGQIRAEGVVGIARAFLGSGARSVLVALWALEDGATKQFMSCFYEHLVRGESASKSLHNAMKWMRGNNFTKVSEWAPFMLIGDDVTFDFGK